MAAKGAVVTGVDGPAVRTTGLGRRFRSTWAVRDVELEVPRGEVFGLVGPDGAGKTTLLQMLCGILDFTVGRASVLGLELPRKASRLAGRVGYMSQEFSLYGSLSVAENLRFFADVHGVPAGRREERAGRLLRFSRLAPYADRLARNLSGGMQKKLALATVLLHDPEILFLDEPTTGVDPVSRREFWRIVSDFVAERVTVVVATPYLDEAERCHRVGLMHRGRLLAIDTPAGLKTRLGGQMAEIWSAEERAALRALRRDPEVRDAEVFGRSIHALLAETAAYRRVEGRLEAAGVPIEAARCIEPSLEDVFVALLRTEGATGAERAFPGAGPTAARTRAAGEPASSGPSGPDVSAPSGPTFPAPGGAILRPRAATSGSDSRAAVEARALTRRFGNFTAVDRLSFSIQPGEVFGLLGPNGSGKSTTIRMLTGILPPSSGEARIGGLDVAAEKRRIRPIIGYVSQRFSLYGDLTVEENLDFFAGIYGVPAGDRERRKAWALSAVGLRGREGLRTRDLPGGWKQRLALAGAILHRPKLLFLDEPTSGVDPLSRRFFWDLIFELAESGVTALVTTHYMDEAERCDRLALLNDGRLVAAGTPAELRAAVGGRVVEVSVERPLAALSALRSAAGVRQVTLYGARLHVLLSRTEDEATLRSALIGTGHEVRGIVPVPLTMEDVFTALMEEGEGAAGRAA